MEKRCRVRELGTKPGILPPGKLNAITDVNGVRVGHVTVIKGDDIRSGVTAILPHSGNVYQEKIPAGVVVGNGYGKLTGSTQIAELGEIETPILLTNTLCVPQAADALIDWTLAQPGNENVASVNPIVGETNDGWLNNIRKRVLTAQIMRQAIENAADGPVPEGAVGAGTGTVAFGWKGGIGTSSRALPNRLGGYILGALVQSNFGGVLQMGGIPVGQKLGQYFLKNELVPELSEDIRSHKPKADKFIQQHNVGRARDKGDADGSIMIILATDAPLSDRNLTRLARRALAGLARTGAAMSDGSGDYVIAFSTAEEVRRTPQRRAQVTSYPEIPNALISPLFEAAIEATEEAIYNSLCMAETVSGYRGTIEALPLEKVRALFDGS